jgi:hypothetical protein
VDTPLTAMSVLPQFIGDDGWDDLFVIYKDAKDGSILALHK